MNTLDIGTIRSETRAAHLRLVRNAHTSLAVRRWCDALLDAPELLRDMTAEQVVKGIIDIDEAILEWMGEVQ